MEVAYDIVGIRIFSCAIVHRSFDRGLCTICCLRSRVPNAFIREIQKQIFQPFKLLFCSSLIGKINLPFFKLRVLFPRFHQFIRIIR